MVPYGARHSILMWIGFRGAGHAQRAPRRGAKAVIGPSAHQLTPSSSSRARLKNAASMRGVRSRLTARQAQLGTAPQPAVMGQRGAQGRAGHLEGQHTPVVLAQATAQFGDALRYSAL